MFVQVSEISTKKTQEVPKSDTSEMLVGLLKIS